MSTVTTNSTLSRSAAIVVKRSDTQTSGQAFVRSSARKSAFLIGSGPKVQGSPRSRAILSYKLKQKSSALIHPDQGEISSRDIKHKDQNPQSIVAGSDSRFSIKKVKFSVVEECSTADTSDSCRNSNGKSPKLRSLFKSRSGKGSVGTQPEQNSTKSQSVYSKQITDIPVYFKTETFEREKVDPRLLPSIKEGIKVLKALHNDTFETCPTEHQVMRAPFRYSKKPILVLDLDETLVHCCNFDCSSPSYDVFMTYITPSSGRTVGAKMNIRPFAQRFLELVSTHYEVVAYTASESSYASTVCSLLDPQKVHFKHILSRDDCLITKKGFRVKDLRLVAGLDMSRTVLVDNSFHCFAPQINNGIPILPFTYEKDDRELMKLLDFLLALKDQEDFPTFLQSYFNLRTVVNITSVDEVFHFLRCEKAPSL